MDLPGSEPSCSRQDLFHKFCWKLEYFQIEIGEWKCSEDQPLLLFSWIPGSTFVAQWGIRLGIWMERERPFASFARISVRFFDAGSASILVVSPKIFIFVWVHDVICRPTFWQVHRFNFSAIGVSKFSWSRS